MNQWIILGIVVLVCLILTVILIYNSLVKVKLEVEKAWRNIDVQLQRRYDLIPNLAQTVQQYASHEKAIFDELSKARRAYQEAREEESPEKAALGGKLLNDAMMSINAVAEQYPDLKASQNFMSLQEELTTTENKIAYSRDYYNSAAQMYNTKIHTVPINFVASFTGFYDKRFFQVENEEARSAVNVGDIFNKQAERYNALKD